MLECDYLENKKGINMKTKYIKSSLLIMLTAVLMTSSAVCVDKVSAVPANTAVPTTQQTQTVQFYNVAPLTIVNSPKTYLNKNVIMKAKFDKFTTLGLDYKPAFKSSEEYISFLIKRDDTTFNIPLSEMKLFLKRNVAEKYIDLKTNDEIEIKGLVFSDALGDTWIDVKELKITQKAPEDKKSE